MENFDNFEQSIRNPKRFRTITSAINYLDGKFGRDTWLNESFLEVIVINNIRTTVSCGLRMDPNADQYNYFRKIENKYRDLFVRLS